MTGRATAKVAALLASISLLAGAQLLVPASAGAEPSNGVDCSAAIDFDACATEADDGTGVTGGAEGTVTYTGSGFTDPGLGFGSPSSDGGGLGAGGDGSGGYQDPSSGAGLSIDGYGFGWGDAGSRPDEPPPSGSNHWHPRECEPLLDKLVDAPSGSRQEKAAFDAYVICLMASRGSSSRADPHAHKLSARQRKASRTTKGRHVRRSTRPSHPTR
jgi:hypothetical protein